MYPHKAPLLISTLTAPWLTWKIPAREKVIYLTFDDGPTPEVTTKVLDLLRHYQARGTFFCLGKNVELHPDIFQAILKDGHQVGNHSWGHAKGWKMKKTDYLKDIQRCAEVFASPLFRPPYGKINPFAVKTLTKHYQIVMWSVLSCDYEPRLSPEQCAQAVIKLAKPGSIVVFHDSRKAEKNCLGALTRVLQHFSKQGFSFKAIAPAIHE